MDGVDQRGGGVRMTMTMVMVVDDDSDEDDKAWFILLRKAPHVGYAQPSP